MAVRIARRAAAFGVAQAGVETRSLEGVGAQGHPVAAAAPDLGFSSGQHPGSQAVTALVLPPSLKSVGIYAVYLLVVFVRPRGLFGSM